jgi:N-acetylglucosamine malate deacetylase 1
LNLVSRDRIVLVLCAHPDDEVGCGGLINRLVEEGREVHYVYFSNCAESTLALGFEPRQLIDECFESCHCLGIPNKNIRGFDIPVRHFPQHRQVILEALVQIRKELNPSLVLCAASHDIHQDHSTLAQEALRAFKYNNIIGYEFPWNQMSSRLDLLVRLDERHLAAKVASWNCYKSQLSRSYHGGDLISALARVRGVQANAEFAESYETMRVIV